MVCTYQVGKVRVEAAGYETEDQWVELGKAAKTLTIKLKAKPSYTNNTR